MRIFKRPRTKWMSLIGSQPGTIPHYRPFASVIFLISAIGAACRHTYSTTSRGDDQQLFRDQVVMQRHLLSSNDTGFKMKDLEDCTFELANTPEGWVVLYLLCTLWIFIALAIVCDDFFVPSLEVISEKLQLSEDVAGATFMAAGSSAPEFFTSVVGVAQESSVGVGTIVGSAVFNILVIIALTAALAGQVLDLDWRPMTRDAVCYGISIVVFVVFAWDAKFEVYEAVILFVMYIMYAVMMKFNPKLMEWMATWKCCYKITVVPSPDVDAEQQDQSDDEIFPNGRKKQRAHSLTGGHARRLSILSQSGALKNHPADEKHIFHHVHAHALSHAFTHRVSSPSSPPVTPLTSTRKDSGFLSCFENTSYLHSTNTSYTDLKSVTPDNREHLRPPPDGRNRRGSLPPQKISEELPDGILVIPVSTGMQKATDYVRSITIVPDVHAHTLNTNSNQHDNNLTNTTNTTPYTNTHRALTPIQSKRELIEMNDLQNLVLPPIQINNRPNAVLNETPAFNNTNNNHSPSPATNHVSLPSAPLSPTSQTHSHRVEHGEHREHGEQHKMAPAAVFSDLPEGDEEDGHFPAPVAAPKDDDKSITASLKSEDEEENQTLEICCCCPGRCLGIRSMPPERGELGADPSKWAKIKFILQWILFVVSFPFAVMFTYTIPDCSKSHTKKWYLVSFIMSVVWIIILSFAMVTIVGRAGCILTIDDFAMGLVVVAIGTSVPDALSSILVARDGYGDMAVSNAIGSNVFDINLGLGLPFLIRMAIDRGKPIELVSTAELAVLRSKNWLPLGIPHVKFGFILMFILLVVIVMFTSVKFRLNKPIGLGLVIIYGMFLVYAFVDEKYCKVTGILC